MIILIIFKIIFIYLIVTLISVESHFGHFKKDTIHDCSTDQLNTSFWRTSTAMCLFRRAYKCVGYDYPFPYAQLDSWRNAAMTCQEGPTSSLAVGVVVDGTHVFHLMHDDNDTSQFVIDVGIQATLRSFEAPPIIAQAAYAYTEDRQGEEDLLSESTALRTLVVAMPSSFGGGGLFAPLARLVAHWQSSSKPRAAHGGSDPSAFTLGILVPAPLDPSDVAPLKALEKMGIAIHAAYTLKLAAKDDTGTTIEEGDDITATFRRILSAEALEEAQQAVAGPAGRTELQSLKATLQQYDVVLYSDDYWDTKSPRPSIAAEHIMVHMASLSGLPVVRFLDWNVLYRDPVNSALPPADAILVASRFIARTKVTQLQGPGVKFNSLIFDVGSGDHARARARGALVAALPPLLAGDRVWYTQHALQAGLTVPTHWLRWPRSAKEGPFPLTVVHAGSMSTFACPGSFIRTVKRLQLQAQSLERGMASSTSMNMRFIMLGGGHLHSSMLIFIRDMGLQDVITVVDPQSCAQYTVRAWLEDTVENERGDLPSLGEQMYGDRTEICVFSLLASADVLVDSCTTSGGTAAVLPLSLLAGTPILSLASATSQEWMPSSDGVRFVHVTPVHVKAPNGRGNGDEYDALGAIVQELTVLEDAARSGACGQHGERCFGNREKASAEAARYFAGANASSSSSSRSSSDGGSESGSGVDQGATMSMAPATVATLRVLRAVVQQQKRKQERAAWVQAVPMPSAPSEEHGRTEANTTATVHTTDSMEKGIGGDLDVAVLRALVAETSQRHRLLHHIEAPHFPAPFTIMENVRQGEVDPISDAGTDAAPPLEDRWVLSDSDRAALALVINQGRRRKGAYEEDAEKDINDRRSDSAAHMQPSTSHNQSRLFCGIFTQHEARQSGVLSAIRDTYGRRCGGFVAFSDEDDPGTNSIALELPMGPQHYTNMWQKTRALWTYLATHHVHPRLFRDLPLTPPVVPMTNSGEGSGSAATENVTETGTETKAGRHFEWFVVGGDDMYILPENLLAFLQSDAVRHASRQGSAPMYLGRPLRASQSLLYNTGGPGYVLNARAVAALYNLLQTDACLPQVRSSLEDLFVAECLRQVGIRAAATHDELHRERFHWNAPGVEYEAVDEFYLHQTMPERGGLKVKSGGASTAPDSVAFHDIKPAAYMRAVHSMLYGEEEEGGKERSVQS